MSWTVQHLPHLSGYCVEWAEPGNYILSRRDELFHAASLDDRFESIGKFPAAAWRSVAARFRPAQRLLRFFYYNVIRLDGGELFVTFDKSVGIFRDGEFAPVTGMKRPCRVLRYGAAVDSNGDVYFGEYLNNAERGLMHIYRLPKGSTTVEIAYTFPSGDIRHIHGIYHDRFTGELICLTGDADAECRILTSNDGFKTSRTLGSGDESWRAVSILFSKEKMYYGTDAEHRENSIYEWDRSTGERRDLGAVNGTVFYSKQIGDRQFFTTTAENAPSQAENVAALWSLSDGRLARVATFEKDALPGGLFMFGTIHLPYENRFDDRLYLNLVATEGEDRCYIVTDDGT